MSALKPGLGGQKFAYNANNVGRLAFELVTDPIVRITPTGILTADDVERDVDVIAYATGCETTRCISASDITGRDGLHNEKTWADGAHASLGVTTVGFPNLFMLYGPYQPRLDHHDDCSAA